MKSLKYAFILLLVTNTAIAQRFDIIARVGDILYHVTNGVLAPHWSESTWFGLVNPDKSPNCSQYEGNYAITIPKGNKDALSILLSAKMADKEVLVTIDDEEKFNGYCKMQYLTLK